MNAKLLAKTIFLLIILLLLVMMGLNNKDTVNFRLPPLIPKFAQPAAVMYFAFFAVGFLTGTVLTAGTKGGGSGGGAGKAKTAK